MSAILVIMIATLAGLAACQGGSSGTSASPATPGRGTSPSSAVASSGVISSTVATPGPTGTPVGTGSVTAHLEVRSWGFTHDGLLSVVIRNNGAGTVQSAHAIIRAYDKFGNTVLAASAPADTIAGARCCTVIGLPPGRSYGLYTDLGARAPRVTRVAVAYTNARITVLATPSPVAQVGAPTLVVGGGETDVRISVLMSHTAGPYVTAQALLAAPNGSFLGVISGGYYCIHAGTRRTLTLQFFHPVPAGSSVQSVNVYPLDSTTARIEKLTACNG